ncbi:MAG: protein-L-isoaspartate(D-aspartate) O-methyltransferase [Thiohalophilus sp.]|uniref:protein-L-isoaspartate(D-aspartate) O-methyltransferase n=1 Tax=Thiohalophilus sp. TaxID=3028392 RepID=UPI00286FBDA2|nr:protein-L-isoaspartate(D-aspartate) O-methyltransferase [Thiohalophilus sp.]MDR9436278.1 protein-L-isoaspartate(D-aspartate) O-methyltransferase [Thiohalophilus sp.]
MADTRQQMLDTIATEARYTASMTGRRQFSEAVMQAMSDVDRAAFIPPANREQAYDNGPLPIGNGQTISQPYIVALMTDLLELTPESVVLEVGTGSGYQAAILAQLARQVYSLERIPELAETARKRFADLGYANIEVRCANGYDGWQDRAPFDGIIVTAAASEIPPALIEQLRPGGRLVIPVGPPYSYQELLLITREEAGNIRTQKILGVAFVPLINDQNTNDVTRH